MGNRQDSKISKCDNPGGFERRQVKRPMCTKKDVLVEPKMSIDFAPDDKVGRYDLAKPMLSKRG